MVVDGSGSKGCELALVKRQAGHEGVRRRRAGLGTGVQLMHCNTPRSRVHRGSSLSGLARGVLGMKRKQG